MHEFVPGLGLYQQDTCSICQSIASGPLIQAPYEVALLGSTCTGMGCDGESQDIAMPFEILSLCNASRLPMAFLDCWFHMHSKDGREVIIEKGSITLHCKPAVWVSAWPAGTDCKLHLAIYPTHDLNGAILHPPGQITCKALAMLNWLDADQRSP